MSAAVLPARLRDTVLAPLNGTELRPEGAADRTRMGWGDNRHVVDPHAVVRVPTDGVLLMRGDLSIRGPGVLHRSPPNPCRAARLLAAVDA